MKAGVRLAAAPRSAELCDLMERKLSDLNAEGSALAIEAKPFEIVTVRVRF